MKIIFYGASILMMATIACGYGSGYGSGYDRRNRGDIVDYGSGSSYDGDRGLGNRQGSIRRQMVISPTSTVQASAILPVGAIGGPSLTNNGPLVGQSMGPPPGIMQQGQYPGYVGGNQRMMTGQSGGGAGGGSLITRLLGGLGLGNGII